MKGAALPEQVDAPRPAASSGCQWIHLLHVPRRGDEAPLALDLVQATQKELAEATRRVRQAQGNQAGAERNVIDAHCCSTPNGWKVTIMLEDCGLEYKVFPVNILGGDQFKPDFLKIAPNNRGPAMVDHALAGGDQSVSIFESAAILIHLPRRPARSCRRTGRRATTSCALAQCRTCDRWRKKSGDTSGALVSGGRSLSRTRMCELADDYLSRVD
jgi:Glutathione S-transferase, N-terminal domain